MEGITPPSNERDTQWVIDLLKEEGLFSTQSKRRDQYGRAELSPPTLALLWVLRLYVIGSSMAIAVQIYIGLKNH